LRLRELRLGGVLRVGAYASVAMHKLGAGSTAISGVARRPGEVILPLNIPTLIILGGIMSGLVGLGTGYLTLRLRGAFFAIATLALAVGAANADRQLGLRRRLARRLYHPSLRGADPGQLHPIPIPGHARSVVVALATARIIEQSRLGYGFATIRDDELAAEACGVPTLRLKLIATTISGALMGMAGAPFPYYIGYLEPSSAFGPRLRRQLHRHADDRRHHQLGRPLGRRAAARHTAAGGDRDHLVRRQSTDRRPPPGRLRHRRAQGHHRPGAGLHARAHLG
jgi:ABC-type branched-subunit amino acid transport system permease subunit